MHSSTTPDPSLTIAIVGGYVVPIDGPPIDGGLVLLREGKVAFVGSASQLPDGAEIVDATGKWVLPGFVEAHAHIGIHEESVGVPGDDTNESSSANTAGVRALDAINIADPAFERALEAGVTTVVVKPGSANPIAGQSVAMKTGGGPTIDERVLIESASIKSALGENPKNVHGGQGRAPVTRMGTAWIIRQALEDARHYRAQREAQPPAVARDLGNEALLRLLDGELLWDVHAHRHDDIVTAIRIADEYELRLVINHGTEAQPVADAIARRGLPVILGPTLSARSKSELSGHDPASAARLTDYGIEVSLTTDHPEVPIDLLVVQAAIAVRDGLPRTAALEAITVNPARIYGLQGRVGALAAGMDADLVVWSGDPFDFGSRAEKVYISGELVHEAVPQSATGAQGHRELAA